MRGKDRAARRPALHQPNGKPRRRLQRGQPTARQHHEQRAGHAGMAQPGLQPPEIARHHRLHIGVGDGGAEPLPLPHLRRDVRRQRNRHRRPDPAHDRGGLPFMRRIDEGMQEADRHGLHPLAHHELNLARHGRLIQRQQHLAGVVQPFLHRQPPAPRHQRLRQLDIQVVLVVAALIAQREDVAEPLGGDQRGPGALALDHRIRRQRRAMDHQRQVGRGQPGAFQHHLHAVQHALLRCIRRGQHLGGPALLALFDSEVSEGAADVDCEPGTHAAISAAQRCATAQAFAKSSIRIASFGLWLPFWFLTNSMPAGTPAWAKATASCPPPLAIA